MDFRIGRPRTWAVTLGLSLLTSAAPGQVLTEITEDVGLDFRHDPGTEGKYWAPEVMGSGGAFFDFDGDGDLDIYAVQGGPLPESSSADRLPNRVYRQEPDGTFTDVTESSGLGDTGYGTGVAVGDIDNDGLVDVFVGNYGPDALYRNAGGGKFDDVTRAAGIEDDAWTASAAFCDLDADGFLDLYVTRYVRNDPTRQCVTLDGAPDYCSPQSFQYEHDTLYRNDGDGTFTDVSDKAGIRPLASPGLGVLCGDFNGDRRMDLYIANDGEPNQLWENQGDFTFEDRAFLVGAALNGMGRPEASMGVAFGDVDGDGDLDMFMTHLMNQTNTLYLNDGGFGFEDASAARGLGAPSLAYTGFGTAFFDVDHDGDLDLAFVNGRVDKGKPHPDAQNGEFWNLYAEPNFLLDNDGSGRFEDVSSTAGTFASLVEVSRGLVLGDVDADGDLDVMVTNTAGRTRLYRNDAPKSGSWLGVRAFDPDRKRDAHGALVTVRANGKDLVRVADPAFSYLVSNDPRAHFGFAGGGEYESLSVVWPDGTAESYPGGPLNRYVTVRKGEGEPVPAKTQAPR